MDYNVSFVSGDFVQAQMGSYDGAEICELVGSFLLSASKKNVL